MLFISHCNNNNYVSINSSVLFVRSSAMRSRLPRVVAFIPALCGRAVPFRAVIVSSRCRYFTDEGNAKGQQDSETRSRARRLSLATGAAVAALGGSYILYNNHFKLKAQEEATAEAPVVVAKDSAEGEGGKEEEEGGKKRHVGFRDQRIIAYEDRLKLYSTPDKIFRLCATIRFNREDIFMTPEDFVRSITPGVRQPDGLALDEFKEFKDMEQKSFKKWMEMYQAELAQKKNMGIFTKLGQCGLISFSDYMFLLVVLSTPRQDFRIAFRMFDLNGDGVLSSDEFERVCQIMQSSTAVGARHKDHAVTGSVDKGLSNALTLYFFGPDKSGKLTVEQFEQFRDDLTEACLWIEFSRYEPDEEGRITERQFAKMILSYADFTHQEKKKYLKRLKVAFQQEDLCGITFEQAKKFSAFVADIDAVDNAMSIYVAGKAALNIADFKHLAKAATGIALDDHLVKVVFAIFDENNDGELSHKEFVEVMKQRGSRGLAKSKDLGFIKLFNAVSGCAAKVVGERLHQRSTT